MSTFRSSHWRRRYGWKTLFAWSYIPQVVKSHALSTSPEKGTAVDSAKPKGKPASRASVPYCSQVQFSSQENESPSVRYEGPTQPRASWAQAATGVTGVQQAGEARAEKENFLCLEV